jgi:hypothetical protein
MTSSIKWIVLCLMFAVISVWLYTAIDSNWSQENHASIWLTICFFLSAVATILCGFSAIENNDELARK